MAKKQEQTYSPTADEIQCSYICHKNDLAYVIQPIQYTKKYKVIKFKISNRLELYSYKENNIDVEFTEYDALKKTMELYTQHAKRFNK
jgi:hypothetical protein